MKLIELLKILNEQEFNALGRFLRSGVVTKDEQIIRLFNYLKKHYPDFDSPRKLSHEVLFSKTFLNEDYNRKKIYGKVSDFVKAAEKFIVLRNMDNTPYERDMMLLHFYKQKENDKAFFKQIQQSYKQKEQEDSHRGFWYYSHRLGLARQQYFHSNTTKIKKNEAGVYFHNMLRETYRTVTLATYQLALEGYNRQIITADKSLKFIDPQIHIFDVYPEFLEEPVIRLYKELWELNKGINNNPNYIRIYLEKNIEKISSEDVRIIATFLINYMLQTVKTSSSAKSDTFKTYQMCHTLGILKTEGIMSSAHFQNFTVFGTELGCFDEVADFMDTEIHFIKPEFRTICNVVGRAHNFFYNKEFEATERILKKNKEIIEKAKEREIILMNALMLRTKYELYKGNDDVGVHAQYYLKIIKKTSFKNAVELLKFVEFTREMANIAISNNMYRRESKLIEELLLKIDAMPRLVCREWLIQKISELKK